MDSKQQIVLESLIKKQMFLAQALENVNDFDGILTVNNLIFELQKTINSMLN